MEATHRASCTRRGTAACDRRLAVYVWDGVLYVAQLSVSSCGVAFIRLGRLDCSFLCYPALRAARLGNARGKQASREIINGNGLPKMQ